MSIKIKVKCVCCGATKELLFDSFRNVTAKTIQDKLKESPMCDKCFSPMIAEKVKVKNE